MDYVHVSTLVKSGFSRSFYSKMYVNLCLSFHTSKTHNHNVIKACFITKLSLFLLNRAKTIIKKPRQKKKLLLKICFEVCCIKVLTFKTSFHCMKKIIISLKYFIIIIVIMENFTMTSILTSIVFVQDIQRVKNCGNKDFFILKFNDIK